MTVKFQIEGLENKESETAILASIHKMVGVEEAAFDIKTGELELHLQRPNNIILKLVEHVVHKEDDSLVVKEYAEP